MKKIVTVTEVEGAGLESFLGQKVLLLCANYFYTGTLSGVNKDFVELTDPAIVYETGPWTDAKYKDVQALGPKTWYVMMSAIESFGISK